VVNRGGRCGNILILGVGSILMMDEGVGVRAIEELRKRYVFPDGVELLDGGTSGIELLQYIEKRDLLIIIDAIKSGHPPGTVLRIEGKDVPARFRIRLSPHQLGISDLLAAATISDALPKKMVLFGIEPEKIELGLGFSDPVKAGFDRLLTTVVDELRSQGCPVERDDEPGIETGSIWGEI